MDDSIVYPDNYLSYFHRVNNIVDVSDSGVSYEKFILLVWKTSVLQAWRWSCHKI